LFNNFFTTCGNQIHAMKDWETSLEKTYINPAPSFDTPFVWNDKINVCQISDSTFPGTPIEQMIKYVKILIKLVLICLEQPSYENIK